MVTAAHRHRRPTALAGSGDMQRRCRITAQNASSLSSRARAVGSAISHAGDAWHAQLWRRAIMRLPGTAAASHEARKAAQRWAASSRLYARCTPTVVRKGLSCTARSSGGHSRPTASWRLFHMCRSRSREGPSKGRNSAGPEAMASVPEEKVRTGRACPPVTVLPNKLWDPYGASSCQEAGRGMPDAQLCCDRLRSSSIRKESPAFAEAQRHREVKLY
jgi:hypothetical protein